MGRASIAGLAWSLTLGLIGCGSGTSSGSALPSGAASDGPPTSVVLVSLDTLRADRLGAYGYRERALSPNLDALATEGILFVHCAAAAAWTTPAHASLFTGQIPSTHGMTQSFLGLRSALEQGEGFNRLAASQVTLAEALAAGGRATAAFTGGVTLDPVLGFAQGFERYESTLFKLDGRNMGEVEAWLDGLDGAPFFLFWHTFEVHTPFLDGRFLDEVLEPEAGAALRRELDGQAADFSRRSDGLAFGADLGVATQRAALARHGALSPAVVDALYCGGVASADRWVGELFDMLRARGRYDDTLVVVTSDHGEELAEHDPDTFYHSHGHSLYEELVHVPLIVKLPGARFAGTRIAEQVSAIDVMPTVLDLVGTPLAAPPMQGVSLRPLWESGTALPRRHVSIEALLVEHEKKALTGGGYKYILSVPAGSVRRRGRGHVPAGAAAELYELRTDPGERRDLLSGAVTPEHRELARVLDRELRASLESAASPVESVSLGAELLEGLQALGYGGDDEPEEGPEKEPQKDSVRGPGESSVGTEGGGQR